MKKIEVKSKTYTLLDLQDELVLYTKDLNQEIAYSLFSQTLSKVALARNLNKTQLTKLFAEINPENLEELGLIKINIIGGDNSKESREAAEKLISQLQEIDNNRNIIDIKSFDCCERLHPNSFEVDCYHGGIRGIA